jgi:hypothetical protein
MATSRTGNLPAAAADPPPLTRRAALALAVLATVALVVAPQGYAGLGLRPADRTPGS